MKVTIILFIITAIACNKVDTDYSPQRITATATTTAVVTLPLGYKTDNAVTDAQRLSNTYSKPVSARIAVELTTGVGIDQINSTPLTTGIVLNIVYDRNDVFPPSIDAYKQSVLNFKAQLKRPVSIVYIENEELFHNYYNNLSLYAQMVKANYDIWMPSGVKVGTGGTSMSVAAGMTYQYYLTTKGQSAANDFLQRWGYNPINRDYGNYAISEIKELKKLYMPSMQYCLHYNVRTSTVDFIPEILKAVKYYSNPYPFAESEMSCMELNAGLITSAMNYFCGNTIYVVGYSRSMMDRSAILWNGDMENAFMKFGK